MNTVNSYAIGDTVERRETRNIREGAAGQKSYTDHYLTIRTGTVVDVTDRVRVKWVENTIYKNGVLVAVTIQDGKRTWIAPARLKIVTPA